MLELVFYLTNYQRYIKMATTTCEGIRTHWMFQKLVDWERLVGAHISSGPMLAKVAESQKPFRRFMGYKTIQL